MAVAQQEQRITTDSVAEHAERVASAVVEKPQK
jgi:hypothetical protein